MDLFQPSDEHCAAQMIATARMDRRPCRIVGHDSKKGLGRPVQAGRDISTHGFSGIRLYEPKELVIVAGAGTPLHVLEKELAASGQRLSFEPPNLGLIYGKASDSVRGTVGGMVACNLSGPRRIRDGAARDNILGMRLINGFGEIIKTGGRVMKNVTGLDVSKIVAGSYGTTGLITEVAFKVLPAPECAVTLCLHDLSDEEGCRLLRAALATPWEVSGAVHLTSDCVQPEINSDEAVTLIRLEGFEDQVRYRSEALKTHLMRLNPKVSIESVDDTKTRQVWQWVRDYGPAQLPPHNAKEQLLWRLSLRPTDGPAFVSSLKADFETALKDGASDIHLHTGPRSWSRVWYDWGGGLVFILCDLPDQPCGDPVYARFIRQRLEAFGGHATLMRAPEALRATTEVFQPLSKTHLRLEHDILKAFDPDETLNPGRMRRIRCDEMAPRQGQTL